MNEINQRIEFENPDHPIVFLNISIKKKGDVYKYQCLLKDHIGLFHYNATIYEKDLSLSDARSCIDQLTNDAFLYFEELDKDER